MKKLTKIISIAMLIAMTLALCACGSTAATTAADSSAPAADTAALAADSAPASPSNALEQIKADGVLSVALSPDFAPMEFVDSVKLQARVDDIAKGAALMTGTEFERVFIDGTAETLPNYTLEACTRLL